MDAELEREVRMNVNVYSDETPHAVDLVTKESTGDQILRVGVRFSGDTGSTTFWSDSEVEGTKTYHLTEPLRNMFERALQLLDEMENS